MASAARLLRRLTNSNTTFSMRGGCIIPTALLVPENPANKDSDISHAVVSLCSAPR